MKPALHFVVLMLGLLMAGASDAQRLRLLVRSGQAIPTSGGGGHTPMACVAVGPTSAGTADGLSWTNRRAGLPTGSSIARNTRYYLMDGSYGAGYSFTKANSSTQVVHIIKAQSYDFGRTADGCTNDISSGWNAGTMGASTANFTDTIAGGTTPASGLTPGYVIWDGNGSTTHAGCGAAPTAGGGTTDCGIKITGSVGWDGCFDIGANNNDGLHRAPNWTVRYVECVGAGAIDESASNTANEENSLVCRGACDALTIEYVYWRQSSCNFIKLPWSTSTTIHHVYFDQNFSATICHGQMLLTEVDVSNVTVRDSVFEDIQGTGLFVCVTGCDWNTFAIYGNVLFRPSGSTRPGFSNGILACINASSLCQNMLFYQNTVINYDGTGDDETGIKDENGGGSYTWKNNLFYNSNSPPFDFGGGSPSTFACTNNSFLNTGGSVTSPCSNGLSSNVVVTSGAADPFTAWTSKNFHLSLNNSNTNNGASLGSPYNTDPDGVMRAIISRGAYEFQ